MSVLKIDYELTKKFYSNDELENAKSRAKEALKTVKEKSGEGNDFLGWYGYPLSYDKEEFERVKRCASTIIRGSEVLVVIGIGGSYLGAKAAVAALSPYFEERGLEVIFAGNSISSTYLVELRDYLKDKDFSVNVISKSGTTTEPAIAFRFFYELLKKKYMKEELKEHVFLTTDAKKGALRKIGEENGFEMFVVPEDMGGRYSVLSSVGLLPIACAGFDIDKMMAGAKKAHEELLDGGIALEYAALRNLLLEKNYNIEILEAYEPSLSFVAEWWKQLFGESEGKDHKGIFPASCIFSTDLHSMGQYIQEGRRNLFETVIKVENAKRNIDIPFDKDNLDELNYLLGKSVNEVNNTALEATVKAHDEGGVPEIKLLLDEINEFNLGYLFYFFELSCAISGYMLGVNPFNQPGVEAYKKNMFEMLGKPGYKK
ncbi:MAG: glucose-6-phosphate isomerase [Gammaproteobacteria bacterium]|nr:glucose-6-phosphate isomerase [Gammaproteobacteria bacterium]